MGESFDHLPAASGRIVILGEISLAARCPAEGQQTQKAQDQRSGRSQPGIALRNLVAHFRRRFAGRGGVRREP
ncbi:hypothetical protein D3C80_944850 [compost metagenome]